MNVSINNVRPLSAVSFDQETSSKKASNLDTFEMVRGGSFLKSHKQAAGKASSSSDKEVADATQTQDQAQGGKAADAKEEAPAQAQGQSQAQGAKDDAAQAQGK